ncbi:MAG: hypothetical protein JNM81_04400 [Rhodospirillaceae bacterium]|nr:hypothetical protein [Rhodospirillaceae bacterium]
MRALLIAAAVLASSVASAQTLPKSSGDPLVEICSGFLEQNRLTVGGDMALLCNCLVREVKAKLSSAEMETYDKYNAAAKPLPPALQNKISGIAVQCLSEAQQPVR